MTHRAVVERNDADDADHRAASDWTTLHEALPCFLWVTSGQQLNAQDMTVTTERMRALVPLGTDIAEGDRIALVKDRNEGEVYSRRLLIDAVVWKHDHLELELKAIR